MKFHLTILCLGVCNPDGIYLYLFQVNKLPLDFYSGFCCACGNTLMKVY